MLQLEGSQRRYLKRLAHSLKPMVHVGKNGVSDNLILSVDKALNDHELIKIKFLDYKTERRELSKSIAEKTGCELVDIIGNVALLYRQSPDKDKRKIRLKPRSSTS